MMHQASPICALHNIKMRQFLLLLFTAAIAQQPLLADGGLISDAYNLPTTDSDSVYSFDNIAALDLDQRIIVARTASESSENLDAAYKVFTNGSFSASFAELTITDESFLNLVIPHGSIIAGTTASGVSANGKSNFEKYTGETVLNVQYASGTSCNVGGNPMPITTGCFAPTGSVTINIGSETKSFLYSYNPLLHNVNGLALAGLNKEHTRVGTLNKYLTYYGYVDYDNEWIYAAFEGRSTLRFDNGRMDFDIFGIEGRGAAVQYGIVVLHVWMFVVNGLEDAASKCGTDLSSVDRWDQSVAAYSGSEPIGTDQGGYFLYTLAETECRNFGTCDKDSKGMAPINQQIYQNFREGKESLLQGNCLTVNTNAKRIVELMTIPIIQGILRTTHTLDKHDKFQEIIQGQAAAYTAAIVPLMNDCSAGNAYIIYDDLAPGKAVGGDLDVVKSALERAYDCLGITCDDVGGLRNVMGNGYEVGAEPCGSTSTTDSSVVNQPTPTPVMNPTKQPTQAFAPTKQPTPPNLPQIPQPTSQSNMNNNSIDDDSYAGLVIGFSVGAGVLAALIAISVGVLDHKRSKQFDTADGTRATAAAAAAAETTGEDANKEEDVAPKTDTQIV